jgi:hypothetical protein
MPTRILLEINELEWVGFFVKNIEELRDHQYSKDNEYNCLRMSNGMVYAYNGVYAMTNSDNMAYQIIIVTPEHLGITLIDTKEISKIKKELINKIEIFLTLLHRVIVETTGRAQVPVRDFSDHSLDDIREQIIKDNSL